MDIYEDYNLFCEASVSGCREKFGKELWSIMFGSGEEPDTKTEKDYMDLLVDFIDGDFVGGDGSMTRLFKAFQEMKACEEHFTNRNIITRPAKNTWVYRGSRVVIRGSIAEALGQIDDIFNLKSPPNVDLKVGKTRLTKGRRIMYQPRSPIQSWTSNVDITETFIRDVGDGSGFEIAVLRMEIEQDIEDNPKNKDRIIDSILKDRSFLKGGMDVMILYETKIGMDPDSWLFNEQITNNVSTELSNVGKHENEVIRISKEPIRCNTYIDSEFIIQARRLYKLLDVDIVEVGEE